MKKSKRVFFNLSITLLLVAISFLGVLTSQSIAQAQTGTAAANATAAATAAAPNVAAGSEVTLTFGAFSVVREAYAEIIPLFQDYWLKKTGQKVTFKESYQGSGAQARAIIGGFEADVAALSLEPDITKIVKANLITHDWKKTATKGIVSSSVAVLAVRESNPKGVKDWGDLVKTGIDVITPDPATSGGAQWNLLAAYGAVKRGKVSGYDKGDESALKYLGALLKNVSVLDKDGRESFLNFERGVGDVAITYESETFAGKAAGGKFDVIYPASSILIENPAAVVDVYVDKHGTRPVAEAFVEFLGTAPVQEIFTKYGYRSVNADVAAKDENVKRFPALKDQFTSEEFGGWSNVGKTLFGDGGSITKLFADIKGK